MNKKLLISLASLIILLVITLAFSIYLNRKPTAIVTSTFNDGIGGVMSSSSLQMNDTTTSSAALLCPDGFVPVTLVEVGGYMKKTCAPIYSTQGDYAIGDGSQSYGLSGYYVIYDRPVYRYGGSSGDPILSTTTCSAFTITGGNSDFIQTYKNIIADGNTVNRLDAKGNLLLNIDFNGIPTQQQEIIKKSNVDRPVRLSVKVRASEGRDAEPCESSVNIITAQ